MAAIQPEPKLKTSLGAQNNQLFMNTNRGPKPAHPDEHSNGSSKYSLPTPVQVANMAAEIEETILGNYPDIDPSMIRSLVERNINDLERFIGRHPYDSGSNSCNTSSSFMSEQSEGIHFVPTSLII